MDNTELEIHTFKDYEELKSYLNESKRMYISYLNMSMVYGIPEEDIRHKTNWSANNIDFYEAIYTKDGHHLILCTSYPNISMLCPIGSKPYN